LIFTFVSISSLNAEDAVVVVVEFQPFDCPPNPGLARDLRTAVSGKLTGSGVVVEEAPSAVLNDALAQARQRKAAFVIHGYYNVSGGSVNIYGQIYNPETGVVIDALNAVDESRQIEGLVLPEDETRTPTPRRIEDFSIRLANRILSNPRRTERRDSINEAILSQRIGKEIQFRLAQENVQSQADQAFKVISERDQIVVAVSKFAQKASEAPADVQVINRSQIRRFGYRNLNEALNSIPQVYSHYVGQNWSADFRGLFINNQIERRVLYLQDGKKLNDYFHFGEFYSDLYTDMDRIDRIEVIKGPGAALYGNNSITGVVNIVTRKPTRENEIETSTDYDAGTGTFAVRALYLSKFSNDLSVTADVSHFEGTGVYRSGQPSWGSTRYYDYRLGSSSQTSASGREDMPYYTGQRIWLATGSQVDNGSPFPNFNFDITYKDFSVKALYLSKRVSWVDPRTDGGVFGSQTEFGSAINDRIWGVGYAMLEYRPSYLEKYEPSIRVFRQLGINSDFREKGFEGFAGNTAACCGTSATARLASSQYTQFMALNGGSMIKAYASTAYANGMEFQFTPFRMESSQNFVRKIHALVGGNGAEVNYINYQRIENQRNEVYLYNQGIGDDGRQYGAFGQLTLGLASGTSAIAGMRYDYQKVNRVYRHEYGNAAYTAAENISNPITKTSVPTDTNADFIPFFDPVTGQVRVAQYVRMLQGYRQPFQRKNVVAQDSTPRFALIQSIEQTATTLKLIYSEAFRAVTPQELIRLPSDQGNAESEKVINREVNLIQDLFSGRVSVSLDHFWLRGSTLYAFNAATATFGQSPAWSNTGGSVAISVSPDDLWKFGGSGTSYRLRRASDVSFLDKIDTPSDQALSSPTRLYKANVSRGFFGNKATVAIEYYYNGPIYLMERPPATLQDVLDSNLELNALPPLPAELDRNSLSGKGNIRNYRIYKVPPSWFYNLTISSNLDSELFFVFSIKNILNRVVLYPLDFDSESFSSPNFAPHQLRGFGREFFLKAGYRF
ncbi:MAG TPA: TonB-dependent receptor plug domain-containing protein, partial [Leptospiraceae bacterium]|nr:TonB-dependent receptor plug domain-containing protein [Leptospiraceae bacterium]